MTRLPRVTRHAPQNSLFDGCPHYSATTNRVTSVDRGRPRTATSDVTSTRGSNRLCKRLEDIIYMLMFLSKETTFAVRHVLPYSK